MEALVNQFESEKEAMIQEFSETLNSQDDAIEELQDLNTTLSHSFKSHKNEIKMINKQYQQQLADKSELSSQGIFFFVQQDVIVLIIL